MTETQLDRSTPIEPESEPSPSVDELLVDSIARWAWRVTLSIALFDLAILTSYPFPNVIEPLRGVAYGLFAVVVLLATLAITFLGFRIVTTRIVGRSRAIYVIFLPAMVLFASLLGFAIMTSPK